MLNIKDEGIGAYMKIIINDHNNNEGKNFKAKVICEGGINDFKQLIESSESLSSEGKSVFRFHEPINYRKLM